jgi:hypothetical protein
VALPRRAAAAPGPTSLARPASERQTAPQRAQATLACGAPASDEEREHAALSSMTLRSALSIVLIILEKRRDVFFLAIL